MATAATSAGASHYGGHDVQGSIEQDYLKVGGPSGALGLPLTDELATPDGVGRYNHFQGGSIYWSPSTPALAVQGAIGQRWEQLAWERGPLGYPVWSNEETTPDGAGRVSRFQGGDIYWTPSTGAHEVLGSIFMLWAALNFEQSSFGYPTSGEYAVPGGRRSDFQGGHITWTPADGAVAVPDIPLPTQPFEPVPAGTLVLTGSGTKTVAVNKPPVPVLAHLHTTGSTHADFAVTAFSAGGPTLVDMVSGYDAVVPLDFAAFGTQTTGFHVQSDTTWEIDLIPLAATGTFGKGTTIGEPRSTVWRYVGAAGTARITNNDRQGGLRVYSYDASTGSVTILVGQEGYSDTYVPIKANQYLEIDTDARFGGMTGAPSSSVGPWAITVI